MPEELAKKLMMLKYRPKKRTKKQPKREELPDNPDSGYESD
jgi:hypothetical protein